MTNALIWILTPVLILDCLILGLLVIVQLPKKDAGVGMAFGGGATDALFGAGSGNTLTKLTKYCAGIFMGLVLLLGVMNMRLNNDSARRLRNEMLNAPAIPAAAPAQVGAAGSNAPTFQGLSNPPAAVPAAEVPSGSNGAAAPGK